MLSRLRKAFFGRFLLSLSLLVGGMQVVVGHWAVVVVGGHEGPGWALGLLLAALLVVANALLLPVLRRARRGTGWPRRVARAYMATGLGAAVLLSWAGFLPLSGALSLLGVAPETVFQGFRLASGAVVTTLAGMLVWGFTGGQARIDHTHVRVPLRGLSEDHHGLRIVQISDLHIGNGLEGAHLERLVARVNALEADLVALTGDIFDFDPRHVEDGARRLAGLRARLGVFAVLGNHDTYTGTELVVRSLGEHAPALRLLRGDVVRLHGAAPLYVAGVDDPGRDWTGRTLSLRALDELAARLPGDGPVVLLVHRPEAFPQAARLGFPLVLAGHTHGGQIALPGRGGRHNLARLVTRFPRGLYRENGSLLYVNRGVGVAGPAIRFNCPREIATIELVAA
jgi:hypothetical protein